MITNTQWQQVVILLREEHRLKLGTDYTVLTKYGKTYVTCFEVYKPAIEDVTASLGASVDHWFFIP